MPSRNLNGEQFVSEAPNPTSGSVANRPDGPPFLSTLPIELRLEVYSHCSAFTLLQLAHTCRLLHSEVNAHPSIIRSSHGYASYIETHPYKSERDAVAYEIHLLDTKWEIQEDSRTNFIRNITQRQNLHFLNFSKQLEPGEYREKKEELRLKLEALANPASTWTNLNINDITAVADQGETSLMRSMHKMPILRKDAAAAQRYIMPPVTNVCERCRRVWKVGMFPGRGGCCHWCYYFSL